MRSGKFLAKEVQLGNNTIPRGTVKTLEKNTEEKIKEYSVLK